MTCRHQLCPFEAGLTGDDTTGKKLDVAAASSWFDFLPGKMCSTVVSPAQASGTSAAESSGLLLFNSGVAYPGVKLGWGLLRKNLVLGFCKIFYTLYSCPPVF